MSEKKGLKGAKTKAEVIRTIVGITQLLIAVVTLIVVLVR